MGLVTPQGWQEEGEGNVLLPQLHFNQSFATLIFWGELGESFIAYRMFGNLVTLKMWLALSVAG